MAIKGGARPGAGRKKGVPNKRTAAVAKAVEDSGVTPLAYLLSVMRDGDVAMPERVDAAKAAAPYVHPKLANVELGTKDGKPIQHEHKIVFKFV